VTLHLTINTPVTADVYETACSEFTWNGQKYTTSGDYPFTTTGSNGCDSLVTLHLTILPEAKEVSESLTLCPSELPYTWHGQTLTSSGTYTSVEQYVGHTCDSVIHVLNLTVYMLTAPETVTAPIAICGHPIDVVDATDDIEAHIAAETLYAPNAVITWYVKVDGSWAILTDTPVNGSIGEVALKYVITTDCGDVESKEWVIPVEMPTPENDLSMNNISAVSKYNNRILLLNLNAFEADFGWKPTPEEVTWYKVIDDVDVYGEPGNDSIVGTGHYYNLPDARNLEGSYYALIEHLTVEGDGCASVARTEVLVASVTVQAPQIIPNVARPNETLTLKYLDTNVITEIRVYSTAGELLDTFTAEKVSEFMFNAAHTAGYYMVDVVTIDNKTTLRYVVK